MGACRWQPVPGHPSDGASEQHHITASRLRRLALEIVGLKGDASPLMLKNLPPVCRRLRQKNSWTDPNSTPALEYCSKKRWGHGASGSMIANPAIFDARIGVAVGIEIPLAMPRAVVG